MNRVSILVLLSAILVLAACTGEPGQGLLDSSDTQLGEVPGRPTIQMNADDAAYEGLEGASCWFQAVNDIRCEPGPLDPAPEDVASVMPGDILTFTVGGESAPSRVTATLLDNLDEGGQPAVIMLGSEMAADYEVALEAGLHRISVVAEFSATETDTNFVTTIFAVNVGAALALEPTETPTEVPSAPTDTPAVTDIPTEVPTEVAEPTQEPTDLPPTEEQAAALPPTDIPTVEPTAVPPTLPPTQPPTVVPPSPVPSPTRAAPTAVPPTAAPAAADSSLAGNVPEVVVVKGDNRYEPVGVEFCVADSEDCQTLTGSAPDAQITLAQGDTVRIDLAEGGPARMAFLLTDTAQTRVLDEIALRGNTVGLYTVTVDPGTYLLLIRAEWPAAVATYYFRLQITG